MQCTKVGILQPQSLKSIVFRCRCELIATRLNKLRGCTDVVVWNRPSESLRAAPDVGFCSILLQPRACHKAGSPCPDSLLPEARATANNIGAFIIRTYTILGFYCNYSIVEWAPNPFLIIKAPISYFARGQASLLRRAQAVAQSQRRRRNDRERVESFGLLQVQSLAMFQHTLGKDSRCGAWFWMRAELLAYDSGSRYCSVATMQHRMYNTIRRQLPALVTTFM